MWIGVGALPLAWACLGTTHFLSDVCSYVTALELRRGSSQTFAGVVVTEKNNAASFTAPALLGSARIPLQMPRFSLWHSAAFWRQSTTRIWQTYLLISLKNGLVCIVHDLICRNQIVDRLLRVRAMFCLLYCFLLTILCFRSSMGPPSPKITSDDTCLYDFCVNLCL